MRVSSPITPFLSGTLKSTRMNTRRPLSGRSFIESFAMEGLIQLLDEEVAALWLEPVLPRRHRERFAGRVLAAETIQAVSPEDAIRAVAVNLEQFGDRR